MKKLFLATVAASVALSGAFAQTSEVGQRAENQQDRIAQGVKSGKLSAGQTARLESREAGINHEVHNERAANGGRLTNGERAQVNRQQNRMSGRIYKAKHG